MRANFNGLRDIPPKYTLVILLLPGSRTFPTYNPLYAKIAVLRISMGEPERGGVNALIKSSRATALSTRPPGHQVNPQTHRRPRIRSARNLVITGSRQTGLNEQDTKRLLRSSLQKYGQYQPGVGPGHKILGQIEKPPTSLSKPHYLRFDGVKRELTAVSNALQSMAIPSAGTFRPTVIGKSCPTESIGSRLRDHTRTFDYGVRARSASRRTLPAEGIRAHQDAGCVDGSR